MSELMIVLKIKRHSSKKSESHRVRVVCGVTLYFQFYKPIPVQAWAGPEGSRRFRLPDL